MPLLHQSFRYHSGVLRNGYTLPRPVLYLCVLILSHSNEPASLSLDGRIITADIVNFQKRYDQDQSKVGAQVYNTIHWGLDGALLLSTHPSGFFCL